MIIRCIVLLLLLAVNIRADKARDVAPADETVGGDILFLEPFVVTGKTRGIVPVQWCYFYNRLTGAVISALYPFPPLDPGEKRTFKVSVLGRIRSVTWTNNRPAFDQHLERYGIKPTDRIIAVDGREVDKMTRSELKRWRSEEGDAGDPVTLTLQGSGEDACVFREVIVKRVSPKKIKNRQP